MSENHILKIAILGLENAGKSTMLLTLQKNYHIGDPVSPTKNVARGLYSLFGKDLSVWDYGGQAQYRKNYLKKPERYLSLIKYLFYVIDIQDKEKFDETMKYFNQLYSYISELSDPPLVTVFFHKVDPEIRKSPQIKERIDYLRDKIREITNEAELGYFETTCFDPLTVLSAISLPILGNTSLYNKISTYFAEYAMEHGVEYMNAVVDGLFEVGSFRLFRPHQQAFVDASIEFYNQFSELDTNQIINEYSFEDYNFVVLRGSVEKFNYTINLAYPVNIDQVPPERTDFPVINEKVKELFLAHKPTLY